MILCVSAFLSGARMECRIRWEVREAAEEEEEKKKKKKKKFAAVHSDKGAHKAVWWGPAAGSYFRQQAGSQEVGRVRSEKEVRREEGARREEERGTWPVEWVCSLGEWERRERASDGLSDAAAAARDSRGTELLSRSGQLQAESVSCDSAHTADRFGRDESRTQLTHNSHSSHMDKGSSLIQTLTLAQPVDVSCPCCLLPWVSPLSSPHATRINH